MMSFGIVIKHGEKKNMTINLVDNLENRVELNSEKNSIMNLSLQCNLDVF